MTIMTFMTITTKQDLQTVPDGGGPLVQGVTRKEVMTTTLKSLVDLEHGTDKTPLD